jgi:hypothetical protein
MRRTWMVLLAVAVLSACGNGTPSPSAPTATAPAPPTTSTQSGISMGIGSKPPHSLQFVLTLTGSFSAAAHDVTVDWGDYTTPDDLGTLSTETTLSHLYPSVGTYVVTTTLSIAGLQDQIYFAILNVSADGSFTQSPVFPFTLGHGTI